MTVDLRAASSFEADELAALFTRAYEGYFVPMQVDEEALRFLVRAFDLDLDAGLVAFDDDEPVGLVTSAFAASVAGSAGSALSLARGGEASAGC